MSYLEKYCVPILIAVFTLYIGYNRFIANESATEDDGSFSRVKSTETIPTEQKKIEPYSGTTFYQRFNESFHSLSKRVIPESN